MEINRTLEQRVEERTAEAERRAEELRALAAELARTEQREQRRLAQWLHDDLQHLLVATKMQIALTQSAITDLGLRELLEKACRLIDESIGQSRSLTAELTPPILYESGLVPGLEQLARWVEEKHRLHVTVEARTDVTPENQDAAVVLFNATRELLFNVVKHAGVSEARVVLSEKNGQVQLTVEDQGAGFDPVLARDETKAGFGLLNIRERLRSIGGDIQFRSAPGQGACITLITPAASGGGRR
jgi:signal transduction histidine kinase